MRVQTDFLKAPKVMAAFALVVFSALALTLLPGFAPSLEASEPAALARGDKLMVTSRACAEQDWPNISSACLRRIGKVPAPASVHVRVVSTR
ncbi:hypothetical protein [Afipia carboxidovorans]|uniref:hypothetical protein n=1 Tax=Afipia carboxidovorans TaxID=40137 RepID=UPI00308569CC|nr:hypothetical protein CRBSH125_35680 [Afipia carboxidovorans]